MKDAGADGGKGNLVEGDADADEDADACPRSYSSEISNALDPIQCICLNGTVRES